MLDLRAEAKITDELIAEMESIYDELDKLYIDYDFEEIDFNMITMPSLQSSTQCMRDENTIESEITLMWSPVLLRNLPDWDDVREIQYALSAHDGVCDKEFADALVVGFAAGRSARSFYEDCWKYHHFGPFGVCRQSFFGKAFATNFRHSRKHSTTLAGGKRGEADEEWRKYRTK
jgi:hypothetical protein